MGADKILDYAQLVLTLGQLVANGVLEAIPLFTQGRNNVIRMVEENRNPTDEEWDEVNAGLDEIQRKLHSDAE